VKNLLQSFLLFLCAATDRELADAVEYLKVENRILRGNLPQRITVTNAERGTLVRYGRKLGKRLKELVSIVSPRTFARWLKGADTPASARPPAGPGRPRTADAVPGRPG